MKKILFLAFLLFWPCFAVAQISINSQLLNVLENHQKSLQKKVRNLDFGEKTVNSLSEDKIVYDVLDEHFTNKIANFKRTNAHGFERYEVISKKKRKIVLKEQNLRKIAMQDVKSHLPREISDSCSVTAVGFDYEQRIGNPAQVVGSTVFLHRIVDGIPVRGGSFIQIEYDSDGSLERFDIYWPTYRRKLVHGYLSKSEQVSLHQKNLNESVKRINQEIMEQGAPVKGELKKAYMTLRSWTSEAGGKYLIPNVTYVGTFDSENGEQSLIVDVPLDESLVPQEKVFVYQKNGEEF